MNKFIETFWGNKMNIGKRKGKGGITNRMVARKNTGKRMNNPKRESPDSGNAGGKSWKGGMWWGGGLGGSGKGAGRSGRVGGPGGGRKKRFLWSGRVGGPAGAGKPMGRCRAVIPHPFVICSDPAPYNLLG